MTKQNDEKFMHAANSKQAEKKENKNNLIKWIESLPVKKKKDNISEKTDKIVYDV
jgi:hypothetical protein